MRFRPFVLLFACLLLLPGVGRAQDFGVMESAETIDRGNFKLKANPMLVFGKGSADNEFGISLLAGYGFTDTFDLEGGAAFYDGVSFFGANAELWIVKDRAVDFSVTGGLHFARGDQTFDTTGVDLTFLASGHVTPLLEVFGALDFAFESITEDFIPDDDDSFKKMHLVPGIEYRLAENIDFVAEFGIALNDEAAHYISGGLAYYIR